MAVLTRAKSSGDVLAYRRAMHRAYTEWCVRERVQADTYFMTDTKLRGFAEYLNENGFTISEISEAARILSRYAESNAGVQVSTLAVEAWLNGLRERWALRAAG